MSLRVKGKTQSNTDIMVVSSKVLITLHRLYLPCYVAHDYLILLMSIKFTY